MDNISLYSLFPCQTSMSIPNSFYEAFKEDFNEGIILLDNAGHQFEVFVTCRNFSEPGVALTGSTSRLRSTYKINSDLMLCCFYTGDRIIRFLPIKCGKGEFDFWYHCSRYYGLIQDIGEPYTPYSDSEMDPVWETTLPYDSEPGLLGLDIPNDVIHKYSLTHNALLHILMPSGLVESWRLVQYSNNRYGEQLRLMVAPEWLRFCSSNGYIRGDLLGFFEIGQYKLFRIFLLKDRSNI